MKKRSKHVYCQVDTERKRESEKRMRHPGKPDVACICFIPVKKDWKKASTLLCEFAIEFKTCMVQKEYMNIVGGN